MKTVMAGEENKILQQEAENGNKISVKGRHVSIYGSLYRENSSLGPLYYGDVDLGEVFFLYRLHFSCLSCMKTGQMESDLRKRGFQVPDFSKVGT